MTVAEEVQAMLAASPPVQKDPNPWTGERREIAGYVKEMKRLSSLTPEEAMAWLSSVSARVLEIMLYTIGQENRAATKFRVEELIPLRDETRFQFQVASRRHSVVQLEWEVAGGQET